MKRIIPILSILFVVALGVFTKISVAVDIPLADVTIEAFTGSGDEVKDIIYPEAECCNDIEIVSTQCCRDIDVSDAACCSGSDGARTFEAVVPGKISYWHPIDGYIVPRTINATGLNDNYTSTMYRSDYLQTI